MPFWIWAAFIALVFALLALDLGVFNRRPHVVTAREALLWTAVWVIISLLFNVLVFFMYENDWFGVGRTMSGGEAALQFFTAYLVEKSLSLDNIFVIAMIFTYFRIPGQYQHRVLFWGILGALVLRGTMIGAGVAVVQRFSWIMYVFGALLLFTAAKLLVVRDDTIEPEHNIFVRLIRRMYPVTTKIEGSRFFVLRDGVRTATPLLVALVIVESTDLLFAVDSIPAVFAVTLDPFIAFTSNMFAILGLRSLYFALAAVIEHFRYLKTSLVFLLAFIGVKMLLAHHYEIPVEVSLAMIIGILLVGILASALRPHRDE